MVQDADAAAAKERKRAQRTARKAKDLADKPALEAAKRILKAAEVEDLRSLGLVADEG